MSIVKWNKDVTISTGTEKDQELLMGILQLDVSDRDQWNGKLIEKDKKPSFVELRKSFNIAMGDSSSMLVIVANKGYSFKNRYSEDYHNTTQTNVRISSNGACSLSFDDMNELNLAILESQNVLENQNIDA